MIIRRHLSHNFTIIPNDALLDTRLSIGSRWLLAYLLSRPHDWQVQIGDIQKQANIGRDKAYALVKELIGVGWVRRDEGRQKDGRWGGVEYVVMDQPEAASDAVGPLPENPKAVEPIAANTHLTKDGKKQRTERNQNLSAEEAAVEAEFEEFWAAYPKRNGSNPKAPAKVKYLNARRLHSVKHETLVNAAKSYAASRKGEDPTYTAQAVTWLNQRRWEDQEAPPAPKAAIPMADLTKLVAAYPAPPQDLDEVVDAIAKCCFPSDLPQITEAAQKYALLLKQQKSDGYTPTPVSLEHFVKFKWRDMNRYELYRGGMLNKLAVRPKRERTSA